MLVEEASGAASLPPQVRDRDAANMAPDFAEPVIGRAFARPVGSIRATLAVRRDALRDEVRGLFFPSPLVGEGGADEVRAG